VVESGRLATIPPLENLVKRKFENIQIFCYNIYTRLRERNERPNMNGLVNFFSKILRIENLK
jgi:hypothetical protein